MSDIEKRARELLATEFNAEGRELFERGEAVVITTASALNALRAALTPPEGYVLVPVDPDEMMQRAAIKAVMMCCWSEAQECHEFKRILSQLCAGYRAMLSARPEVS